MVNQRFIDLIKDGTSFKKLVMNLAHESRNEADPAHYSKIVADATKKLERLENIKVKNAFKIADKAGKLEYRRAKRAYNKEVKEVERLKKRCQTLLVEAQAWNSFWNSLSGPRDYSSLKRAFIKTLKEIIEYDCNYDFAGIEEPVLMPPEKVIALSLKRRTEDIEKYYKMFRKEQRRAEANEKWFGALKKSLSASRKKLNPPKKKTAKKPSKKIKSRKRGRPKTSPD